MTTALLYQSPNKWRFGVAFGAAAMIHLAAISFANIRKADPPVAADFVGGPAVITFEPEQPSPDSLIDPADSSPAPPVIDPFYFEEHPSPPPVRHHVTRVVPVVRRTPGVPDSVTLSSAKVFALNAPRPEYPYEARRQKIAGECLVAMTIDPGSGEVARVTISKSTGNQFLDNAAIAAFRRWRFKPGTVSSVTCPVTFTLAGSAY